MNLSPKDKFWLTLDPADPSDNSTGPDVTLTAEDLVGYLKKQQLGFVNPMTTAGDLIAGGAAGAAARLPIGADNNVLTVIAGAPAWAPASGGGGFEFYVPAAPAGAGTIYDDTFPGPVLDAKWTKIRELSTAYRFDHSRLRLTTPCMAGLLSSGDDFRMFVQTLAGGDTLGTGAYVEATIWVESNAVHIGIGVFIRNSGTGQFMPILVETAGPGLLSRDIDVASYETPTAFVPGVHDYLLIQDQGGTSPESIRGPMTVRMTNVDSNYWYGQVSFDGLTFHTIGGNRVTDAARLGGVPDQFGFVVRVFSGGDPTVVFGENAIAGFNVHLAP